MHLHTIMKSGTSVLPCGNVEAHQTRNVQSPVCPTVKGGVALPPSGAARSQVDQGRRRGYHQNEITKLTTAQCLNVQR